MRFSIAMLLVVTLCGLTSCGVSLTLSNEERSKLDPMLQALFEDQQQSTRGYDISYRPDGTPEYAVIVRSANPEDVRDLGIRVTSVFNDVITVRVTKAELAALARLTSVRALQSSGIDTMH